MEDIATLLRLLPKPVYAIVLVVLHRPFDKTSHLREILSRESGMPVVVAADTQSLLPGVCYIGEPDGHLTLAARGLAHLVTGRGDDLRNRTVDTLFNSVAAYARGPAIAIVLSGFLDDGSRGLAAVRASNGITMVLEPGGKMRGMQQNAIEHDGAVDFVGPVLKLAELIGRMISDHGFALAASEPC